jgi:polyhydroxyalkanoate synthesis repressor PhaR
MPAIRRAAPPAAKKSSKARKPADKLPEVGESDGTRVLKKYPNRRLYDTVASSYITLTDVKKMVMAGQPFVVRDAKSDEDLTRSILLQVILEEETGGAPMFTAQTLAQIIRFYGHAMQGVMGSYLEKNLQTFTEIQGRLGDPSLSGYDPAVLSPERWSQFLSGQAPAVQGLMSSYLEQSKSMFTQMQEQMAKQPGTLLFPGMPGFVTPKR